MSEEPKRVFCKDCKHRLLYRQSMYGSHFIITDGKECMAEPVIIAHPIYGDEAHPVPCELRNAKFDCVLFEAGQQPIPWDLGPKIVEGPPTPEFIEFEPAKKPWWRFWS